MTSIDTQSSTHGPTGSKTLPDMISNFGNGGLVLATASRRKATVRAVGGTISVAAPSTSVSYECSPMSSVSVVLPRELAIRLPVSDTRWIS